MHHPVEALVRERAVLAHPLDVEETSLDLPPDPLPIAQPRLLMSLRTRRSVGSLIIVSVRSARPSLKHCLT